MAWPTMLMLSTVGCANSDSEVVQEKLAASLPASCHRYRAISRSAATCSGTWEKKVGSWYSPRKSLTWRRGRGPGQGVGYVAGVGARGPVWQAALHLRSMQVSITQPINHLTACCNPRVAVDSPTHPFTPPLRP